MIAGAIVSIFAQRLGRRLCNSCKVEYVPTEEECVELLDADPANPPTIYKAKEGGCAACKGVGYKGRVAIVEILLFDDEMNELLAENASKAELRKVAVEKGFKDMRDDAIMKIKEGITSIEAASKVVTLKR
jgi:general secretion pathway protein E/type IV pilus assembly protein PilB